MRAASLVLALAVALPAAATLQACSGASTGAGPSGDDGGTASSSGSGSSGAGSSGGGSSGAGSSGSGGSGGGVDAGQPRKVCSGFTSATASWSVPDASFYEVNALYGEWRTFDLDGDGRQDLVRAADPSLSNSAYVSGSQAYWQFFRGGSAGFAATPSQWSVPDKTYYEVDALYGEWETFDLDGDGKLDLVRAADPNASNSAFKNGPAAYWQVFKGGASGFAPTPSQWSVPDATFYEVNALYGEWRTFDLDGDGRQDLVRAADPSLSNSAYVSVSGAYWQFFRGGPSGFASTPSQWSVPDATYYEVDALYGEWETFDLDGDGRLDLVRAADPNASNSAFVSGTQAYWEFFEGGASGFGSTPSHWSVPDATYYEVNALYGEWRTFDLDDDGKQDLVRAADPSASNSAFTSGTSAYWQFYKGGSSGFSSTPSQWSVPAATYYEVDALYGEWLTIDLDGDGCLDLVTAADPSASNATFPGPAWHLYPGR